MGIDAGTVYLEVEPDLSKWNTLLKAKLGPALAGMENSIGRFGKRSGKRLTGETDKATNKFERLGDAIAKAGKNLREIFARSISYVKWPAIITGVGALGGALTAAAAGGVALLSSLGPLPGEVVSLAASLGPLSGLLVAYPGMLAAIVQGFAVFKLALGGVTEAVKLAKKGGAAYQEALKDLTPVQRKFVKSLEPWQKRIDQMRDLAGEKLFPHLIKAMDHLKRTVPVVNKIVAQTANHVGVIAEKFGLMLSNEEWLTDIATLGKGNVRILDNLGQSAINLLHVFKDLLITAQPVLQWLFRGLTNVSAKLAEIVHTARESGRLAAFFNRAKEAAQLLWPFVRDLSATLFNIFKVARPVGDMLWRTLGKAMGVWREWSTSLKGKSQLATFFQSAHSASKLFWPILKDISALIFNIMKIAKPFGDAMWASFGRMIKAWRTFSESVAGQNAIAKFFADAQPVLHEFALLIGDIFRGLGRLARTAGIAELIGLLRTKLLPIFFQIVETASGELGPALVSLAEAFLRIFKIFGTETGGLLFYVKLWGSLGNMLGKFLEKHPAFMKFLVSLVMLSAIAKATGISSLINMMIKYLAITALSTKMTMGQVAAIKVQRIALFASAVASKIAAAAQWLWNAALTANPILLVAAAAVLAAVLIIKNWGAVKRFFLRIFNWIKKNWPLLLTILLGPFGLAVALIIKNWGKITGFFTSLPGKIGRFLASIPRRIANIFREAVGKARDVLGNLWSWFTSLPGKIASALSGLPKLFFDLFKKAAVAAGRGLMSVGGKVGGFVKKVLTFGLLAEGGIAVQGQPYIVGEKGPELFVPKVTGRVVPNHVLEDAGQRVISRPAAGDPSAISGKLTLTPDGHAFVRGVIRRETDNEGEHNRTVGRMKRG